MLFKRCISLTILFFFLFSEFTFLGGNGLVRAFSVGEEREYGEKMLTVIRLQFKLLDDPDISQYINNIGDEILSVTGSQYFNYHFYMIADRDFNAFAAPSGLVFVHSGLLKKMENEGELFSVIAHECGHVSCRHIADRIAKSSKVNASTLALMLAGVLMGGGALSQALITGGMATGTSMNLTFSRQDEEEADRVGYRSMVANKRNPKDMVSMLKKMYRISKIRMGKLPPYLLTHPEPQVRMGYVEDLIVQDPGAEYRMTDQFNFNRIQNRVFSLTENPMKLFPRYRKILRTSENVTEKIMAYYGLSQAYLVNNEFDRARENLLKVIQFFPDKPILLTDLGVIDFQQGNFDHALSHFLEVRNQEPGNWYNTFHLAKTLQKTGDPERALVLYDQLSSVIPDYPGLYYQIAEIVAGYGEQGEAHFYLGKYYFCDGNFKTATFHLHKARKSLPTVSKLQKEIEEILTKIRDVKG